MNHKEIRVSIPSYDKKNGIHLEWQGDFSISIQVKGNAICIIANKDGMISLASHLLNLAQEGVPNGTHIHLDDYNSLEQGSVELILERVD